MRKFLALVLALVMTMSLVTVSAGAATTFVDDAKITNAEAVEVLNAMGILGGYPDGTYRPEATLSRGAGAKILAYLMLGQEKADNLTASYTVFEDVDDTVLTAPYIEWAASLGIVGGYADGTFGPYKTLSQFAFGKMLLGALRYDAEVEGYAGKAWDKNVYADATYTGIFDGTEANNTACTRDDAARMALGALKADIVVYGNGFVSGNPTITLPNGTIIANNAQVNGCFETGVALWEEYPGLSYYELVADVYGRPGHKWTYGLDFSKFYMDAPVATYTTAVTECQILEHFGRAKTDATALNNVQFVKNGIAATATGLSHTACTGAGHVHGGQGALTQLFKVSYPVATLDPNVFNTATGYVVTTIDTYLAQVAAVEDYSHKVNGKTDLTVSVSDNAAAADWATAEKTVALSAVKNLGYAKDAYVLINAVEASTNALVYLTDAAATYNAVHGVTTATLMDADAANYVKDNTANTITADVEYVQVVGAPTVISAATYGGRATDFSQVHVNAVRENVAAQYEKTFHKMAPVVTAADCKVVDFFVDQYGNMIGDIEHAAAYTYGVISAAKWMDPNSLIENDYAEVMIHSMAAPNGEAVKVSAILDNANPTKLIPAYKAGALVLADRDAAKFSDIAAQNTIYATTELGIVKNYGNGVVQYIDDTAEYYASASFTKGNPNIAGMAALVNNNTNFLVKSGSVTAPVYTTYAGIGQLPSIVNAPAVAVLGADNIYATFVYIDATNAIFAGNQTVVYAVDPAVQYIANGEVYEYHVYVNGAKTSLFSKVNNIFGVTAGLYTLAFDADGMITAATPATFNDNTLDGTVYDGYMIKVDTAIAGIKGLDVSAAKVYVAESLTSATLWNTVGNIYVGDLADLVDGATVKVKLATGSSYVVDSIYVLDQVADYTA